MGGGAIRATPGRYGPQGGANRSTSKLANQKIRPLFREKNVKNRNVFVE
jgi:hypothetical protein